jgi:hypothetical protein
MDEILAITLRVAEELERLGVVYAVGGSLASSLHGIPRATQDVELVADLRPEHIPALAATLRESFYLDEEAMEEAVRLRASFNVIHLETLFKVDIFVAKNDVATRQELQRRQAYVVADDPPRVLVVVSAEDIVVQKLHWFRLGDEVSERQWLDALGVLRVQGAHIDTAYLLRVASLLGVEDLLRRACSDAGVDLSRP